MRGASRTSSCGRGERRGRSPTPKPHWELGTALGIIDFERAAKLSGSRFSILRGAGARLERAIASFFLDRAARNGYVEISPPVLVARSTMWATGQLSKFADQMFRDEDADLFLIPTSEVPLTALHRDEILGIERLPLQYAAHTPCFRKEAGAAGKDTRGLIRQHQFEKVELVWLTLPERSFDDLDRLTAHASGLLEELELPHRVMLLCAGDTGFNAAKTYDLEVWLPSDGGAYREISSCSNCTDFSGAPFGDSFPARCEGPPRARAHAQRFGTGHRPHAVGGDRELPATRRRDRHPEGAAAVCRFCVDRTRRLGA